MKYLKYFVLSCVISIIMPCVVFAAKGEWQQVGNEWQYVVDGSPLVSEFKLIDNKWYYFDSDGKMVHEPQQIDDEFYLFKEDGTADSDKVVEISGKRYTSTSKGQLKGISEDDFYAYIDSMPLNAILNVKQDPDTTISDNNFNLKVMKKLATKLTFTLPISPRALADVLSTYGFDSGIVDDYIRQLEQDVIKSLAEKTGVYFYKLYNIDRDEIKKILTNEDFTDVCVKYGVERTLNFSGATKGVGEFKLDGAHNAYVNDMKVQSETVRKSMNDAEVNACIEALAKDTAIRKAKAEEERAKNQAIQESLAAKNKVKQEEMKAKLEAEEAARKLENDALKAQRDAIRVKMDSVKNDSMKVELDDETKVHVNFKYPVLSGYNADALNNVINSKWSSMIYHAIQDKVIGEPDKIKLNNGLTFNQLFDEHMLEFCASGSGYTIMIYIDTNTLEISYE